MSFLCTTRNKEVSYNQCVNECQYFFKSACIDQMNEAYNQALEDAEKRYREWSKSEYGKIVADDVLPLRVLRSLRK